jgi:DNA repair exonuclease SbcCD ATPase subunit
MVDISLYALLGILEVTLLLVVLAGVAVYQWRRARRELIATRQALREARSAVKVVERPAQVVVPQRSYVDFLGEQLEQSSLLLGDDPAHQAEGALTAANRDVDIEQDAGRDERQMLAARHQFLQLEIDVQKLAAAKDPEARRSRVISGMRALLDGLGLSPAEAMQDSIAGTDAADGTSRARSEELKLRDQIEHLRSVIGNQHDVMRELRQLLEEHGADSDELREALRKLGDAEAQGTELQRCLEVMERENTRLKQAANSGAAGAGVGPDAEMLRDLVGSQQRTIGKLQGMLQSLSADPDKARELQEAIGKIQRANNELNSCVMVLEDENSRLRGRVEVLEERLAGIEPTGAAQLDGSAHAPEVELPGVEAPPDEAAGKPATTTAAAEKPPADDRSDTDALLNDLFGGGTGKTG